LAPPNREGFNSTPHSWHSRAGGGAVHSIRSGRSGILWKRQTAQSS